MNNKETLFASKDCHIVINTEELSNLKEQLFSRGNKRLREISRIRRIESKRGEDESVTGDITADKEDPASIAKRWSDELSRVGVEKAVILCEAPTARDFIFSVTQFARDKLMAFTNLDPLQTWSAEDLKRDVARGFVGLNLLPTLQHFHVYDRRAYGLYEMCERLKIPLMVHFGVSEEIFADMRFANPLDLQPVARDFPEVPFIVPGLGSGFLRELLMLMNQCPNVYADTSGIDHCSDYQTQGMDIEGAFDLLLKVSGSERILFGSGSGSNPGKKTTYRTETLRLQEKLFSDLCQEEQRQIYGETLMSLLKRVDQSKAREKRKSRFSLRSNLG